MELSDRVCLYCGKGLRGRVDKKFCDDNCRNSYNNSQNSEQTSYMRQVNLILRKNRKILSELLVEKEEFIKLKKQKLIDKGFNLNYHTHHYITQKQQTYFFCYEYGFLPLEQDYVLIVKRKDDN